MSIPHSPSSAVRRLAGLLGALVVPGALVVWQTWPLAVHLWDGEPPALVVYDWQQVAWALAWQVHAVATGAWPPNGNIYHPTPDALFYGVLGTGLLPTFAPAFLWSGDALFSVKISYLLALGFTGASVHGVLWAWTRSWLAGAVGVAVLLSCQLLVTMPLVGTHWAALWSFAPLIWVAGRVATWRGVVAIAVLAAIQGAAEPMYVAVVVLAVLGVAGGLRLLRPVTRARGARILLGAALSLVLLSPIIAGYAVVRATNPELESQTMWLSRPDLLLLQPLMQLRSLPGVLPSVFLVLALATALAARRLSGGVAVPASAWLDAGVLAVVPVALSVVLPALATVPGLGVLGAIRVPARLVLAGFVGIGLIGGLAWNETIVAARARGGRRLQGALGVALLLPLVGHHAIVPPPSFPLRAATSWNAEVASVLRQGRGPVLELPATARDAHRNARAMFRSIGHWRPLVNGYGSFWPAGFEARMEDAARLPDPDALERLVRATQLSTIVVHLDELPPGERQRWQSPAPLPGLVPLLGTPTVLVLQVVTRPATPARTAPAGPDARGSRAPADAASPP